MKAFLDGFFEKLRSNKGFRIVFIACCSALVLILTIIIIVCSSASKKNHDDSLYDLEITATPIPTPTPIPSATPIPTPTPEPTPTPDLHIGESKSALTGLYVKDEFYNSRPYCIMFNNIKIANPQSGIGDASIIYEALVEAGITRLMGVFEGLDENSSCAERIGSVRSARHYYASIADEYDAIFIHYGETTYATKKIKKLKLDHLEGTYGVGNTVYYRDKTIEAPHNAFASLKGILAGIDELGIRKDHEEGWTPNHFTFSDEIASPETLNTTASEGYPSDATHINLNYSTYMDNVYLDYDVETGLYSRSQFKDTHIDYNTGEPLTFTNVIIQIVHEFDKDKNGYQDIDFADNSGAGYYISQGKCIPIFWTKNESTKYMMYFDESGNVLVMNPGKTFISIFPDFRESKLIIE